tara:strand:+ start:655 stop:1023 length:369 start_codon:yes stop_codon:yes gene_type:complete
MITKTYSQMMKGKIINGLLVRSDIAHKQMGSVKRWNGKHYEDIPYDMNKPINRFTKEEVREIILGMEVGDSIQLRSESERNIFHSVAKQIEWYEDIYVKLQSRMIEVDSDNFYLILRMWRTE